MSRPVVAWASFSVATPLRSKLSTIPPRLSRRNYVCIGLRGPQALCRRPDGRMGYTWGLDGQCDALVEDYVFRAVEQPAYDDLMAEQIAAAREAKGEGDLAALLHAGDTWEIS